MEVRSGASLGDPTSFVKLDDADGDADGSFKERSSTMTSSGRLARYASAARTGAPTAAACARSRHSSARTPTATPVLAHRIIGDTEASPLRRSILRAPLRRN